MKFPQARVFPSLLLILILGLLTVLPVATSTSATAQSTTVSFTRLSSRSGDLPAPGANGMPTASQVFDVDGDGDLDFVLGLRDDSQGSVVWYRRDNNGWTRLVIESSPMPIEAGGTFHDIDGDGDQDVVFGGDWRSNDVWWWENPRPNYNQAWTRRLIKDSDANQHHDMAFGDVDGDGVAELVFWNQGSGKLYLAELPANPRTSGLWPLQSIFTWSSGPAREGLNIVDIDGDGKRDIVGGGSWFKHNGVSFGEQVIDTGQRQSRVAVDQLVPGGYPEVVMVPGDGNGPLNWYQWTGSTWTPRTLVGVVDNGHSLELVDLDNDGHLDIFNAEMRLDAGASARMWVFYGDSSGNFREELLATGFDNHESRVADLDNDGNLDILVKPFDWDTPRLDVWLNDAAPRVCTPSLDQWQRHVVDSNQRWRAVFVDSADINRDGEIDIISGGDWYQNPGSPGGNWTRRAIGSPVNNMAAVHDFNGDGAVDILGTAGSSSVYDSTFHWAENNGSGEFTVRSNIDAGDGDFLQGVAVAPFQGDLQVALSWHQANKGIQMLTVPGNPQTQQWTLTLAASISQDEQLSAGDVDRDGDIDLVLGTKWLRNNSAQTPNWHDASRRYRVPLTISAAGTERRNHPAEIDINFGSLLSDLGGAVFALDSVRIVETDQSGALLHGDTPFQLDPATNFDSSNNAQGLLTLLMTGTTNANGVRYYHAYFETVDGSYTPVSQNDQVVVTDSSDEGQASFKVDTQTASYQYQKNAAGFSSLLDANGNDWVGFGSASGSSGEFRGIPNLVYPEGYFHPGDANAGSTLRHDGPLKATIESKSNDGAWEAIWEIFPTFARMTVLKQGHDYWFLYEGTPGGQIDLGTDFVVRADGTVTSAATAWTGDLEPEEWLFFADPSIGQDGRALFMAQHQNDTFVDSYRDMNGEMTVFGFGRSGVVPQLNSVPRQFTMGLLDETTHAAAAPLIRGAYRSVTTTVGQGEVRTTAGGAWEEMTLNSVAGLPDRNRLADINGDGRLDVVVGYEPVSSDTERLAWYRQPADVTAEWSEVVIATLTRPMSVDARDMDRDGDIDVVVGEHHPSDPSGMRLIVFENRDGNGTSWTQHVVYTGDEHHDGAHVVDIDQDGDFDIVSIGWINDKVVLYENLSDCVPDGGPTATPRPTNTPSNPPPGSTPTNTPEPVPTNTPEAGGPCEVASSNRIRNPGFEAGTGEWFFYTNGSASYSTTTSQPAQCDRAAQVVVNGAGSNVQLSQSGIRLESGVRYRLSFAAKASVDRSVGIYLHKDGAPYGSYGFGETVALARDWQRYSYEFTASGFTGTTMDTRLRVWLVTVRPGETVYFDDFVLARADAPPTATPAPPAPTNTPEPGPTATPELPPTNTPEPVPGNELPVADAGNDQTVTDQDGSGSEAITLDARASRDDDGTIVAYAWQSDSGVEIPPESNPTVDFPVGTHQITLTVTDDDGDTASDTVGVIVDAAQSGGDDERVSTGLAVLYTFQEGSGNIVRDVAASGPRLDLTIANPAQTTWLAGGGLAINGPTLLSSSGPASKIIDACRSSNEVTLEAWVAPRNVTQDGPARVLSLSASPTARNFTLGQGLWGSSPTDLFDVRLRTTSTDLNGTPSLTTAPGAAKSSLTHIVYTRSSIGAAKIFVDGVQVKSGTVSGNLSNWDTNFRLLLGGEADNSRYWLGDFYLAAVYCQALDDASVEQNFAAGIGATSPAPDASPTATPTPAPDLPEAANQAPQAAFGMAPASGNAPLTVVFDGTASSDLDGTIMRHEWSFGHPRDTLEIVAQDAAGNQTGQLVTLARTGGRQWPLPFTANWSEATYIDEIAQVLDGKWRIEGNAVRPVELGYDRLLAIGDLQWREYEATVPIVIHAIEERGFDSPSNGPGVGLLARWQGHFDVAGERPRTGWQNLGGLGWFRWARSANVVSAGLQMYGYGGGVIDSASSRTPEFGVPYFMKLRVENRATCGNRTEYRFKVWRQDQAEPTAWDLAGCGFVGGPTAGSLLLVAHHVDASFGPVSVRPVGSGEASAVQRDVVRAAVFEESREKPALANGTPTSDLKYAASSFAGAQGNETLRAAEDAPVIDLWYGNHLRFGQIGQPVPWINVHGNVSGGNEIVSLTYSLNGDPFQPITLGKTDRRLAAAGDFNIELPYTALVQASTATIPSPTLVFTEPGEYPVQLTVFDEQGAADTLTRTVRVD